MYIFVHRYASYICLHLVCVHRHIYDISYVPVHTYIPNGMVPVPYVHTYVKLDAIHMYVSMYVYACMYDMYM